jgi:hypothetical protein
MGPSEGQRLSCIPLTHYQSCVGMNPHLHRPGTPPSPAVLALGRLSIYLRPWSQRGSDPPAGSVVSSISIGMLVCQSALGVTNTQDICHTQTNILFSFS